MKRAGTVADHIDNSIEHKVRAVAPFVKTSFSVLSHPVANMVEARDTLRSRIAILESFVSILKQGLDQLVTYKRSESTAQEKLVQCGLKCAVSGFTEWRFMSPYTSYSLVVATYDDKKVFESSGLSLDALYLEALVKVTELGYSIHPEPKDTQGNPLVVGVTSKHVAVREK